MSQKTQPAFIRPPYDALTIGLHWTTLALVVAQFATALSIDHAPDAQTGRLLLTAHRSVGAVLWAIVALRLIWRHTGMTLPPFPPRMSRLHIAGVHISEYGLYGLLLLQPITGMADSLLRGRAFNLFIWQVPILLDRDKGLAHLAHLAHTTGAYVLLGLIVLHAGAALVHRYVLNDGVFEAMVGKTARRR